MCSGFFLYIKKELPGGQFLLLLFSKETAMC